MSFFDEEDDDELFFHQAESLFFIRFVRSFQLFLQPELTIQQRPTDKDDRRLSSMAGISNSAAAAAAAAAASASGARYIRVYHSDLKAFTTVPANPSTTARELCDIISRKSKTPIPAQHRNARFHLYICDSSDQRGLLFFFNHPLLSAHTSTLTNTPSSRCTRTLISWRLVCAARAPRRYL